MDGMAGAGVAGVVAGIGVAMPLGAVGVMLVQEAIGAGWRVAAGGAFGIALVDGFYAAVAVVAGAAVTTALAGHERTVQLAGAALLAAVAAWGLLALRTGLRTGPAQGASDRPAGRSALGSAGRFVGLTLVNPLTAIYFVALAASGGELLDGAARAGLFVVGVLTSSLIWQLVLVVTGSLAGHRMGGSARTITALGGNLLVLGYAGKLALGL